MKQTGIRRAAACVLCALITLMCLAGCTTQVPPENKKIRIGVTVYDQYDTFISELMDDFNASAAEYKDRVTVEVVNAGKNQQTQNKQVEDLIRNGCDIVCVNLVDRTAPSKIIDTAKKNNVPVIFFNRELVEEDLYRWDSLYYVGADALQSGIIQGQIAARMCLSDEKTDRNGDGSIQYVILEGEAGHQDAIVRSEYCVSTLQAEGVQPEKLGYARANWNRTQAQTRMAQMIAQHGNRIELVLANNDDMALGAIDAYREAGKDRKTWPLIIGIDGTEPGLEAVKAGEMSGTVYNDRTGQAKSMFALAFALATGADTEPLNLIDGKYIRLPYREITAENAHEFER